MEQQQVTATNEIRIAGPVGDEGYFFIHDLRDRVWCELRGCFIGFGLGFRATSFRDAFIESSKARKHLAAEVARFQKQAA